MNSVFPLYSGLIKQILDSSSLFWFNPDNAGLIQTIVV